MKVLLFSVVTAVLVYASRSSLLHPRSHGFYRFFAWELMFLLFLGNFRFWFHDLFSIHQLISWLLLTVAAIMVLPGLYLLLAKGKPNATRNDAPLMHFEKTTVLVTTGIYGYIRHPLYGSLLFLTWGIFFKQPTLWGLALAGAATVFLLLTVLREEAENLVFFGAPYGAYMKRSKRFVPFLF